MVQPEDPRGFEIRMRAAERAHDTRDSWITESTSTTIAFGVETLKATALISGGSAAALLAFMGALVAHDQGGLAAWFPWPLSRFVAALVLTCLGTASAYLAQMCFTRSLAHHQKDWAYPYVVDTAGHDRWRRAGLVFQGLTIFLVLASYAALVVGYLATYRAITQAGFIP